MFKVLISLKPPRALVRTLLSIGMPKPLVEAPSSAPFDPKDQKLVKIKALLILERSNKNQQKS